MEHVEPQDNRLLVRRQRLEPDGRRKFGEGGVGRDEECDPGAALVGLELFDDAGCRQHGSSDVEVVAVDEGLGDVETQRGASLGGQKIEVVRNEEGIDGEDGDIVGKGFEEGQNGGVWGGVRGGRADRDEAAGRVEGDVDGAVVAGGPSGGLEERGDEEARWGDLVELGPGEVTQEDVVAEDVGEGARG